MRRIALVVFCASFAALAGTGRLASADRGRRGAQGTAALPTPRAQPAGPRRFVFDGVRAPGLRPRRVTVVLPPGYDEAPATRRFPVVYAHDGQLALEGGLEIARAVDELVAERAIEPWIVVAVDTTADRTAELTTRVEETTKLLFDVVAPLVGGSFRTRTGPADTALVGYSYGGVATLRIGVRHPERVGRLVCMSSSFWWADHRALRDLQRARGPLPTRLWVDVGLREPGGRPVPYMVQDARDVRDRAIRKGMVLGRDLGYLEEPDARHGHAWGGLRMKRALAFALASD